VATLSDSKVERDRHMVEFLRYFHSMRWDHRTGQVDLMKRMVLVDKDCGFGVTYSI
jgi:hypothetical protein